MRWFLVNLVVPGIAGVVVAVYAYRAGQRQAIRASQSAVSQVFDVVMQAITEIAGVEVATAVARAAAERIAAMRETIRKRGN